MTARARALSLDIETCSPLDLRKVGAYRYFEHPETRIICAAAAFSDETGVMSWLPFQGQPAPSSVVDHIRAGGEVAAWNAAFDVIGWNAKIVPVGLGPAIDPAQVSCTMARALYWGLPAKLEDAAPALGLPVVKDTAGHALMLRMCRPRAVQDDGALVWWHETAPDKLARLVSYCEQDVRTERALAGKLLPLPPDERRTWLLDFEANAAGIRVDTKLIAQMLRVADEAKINLDRQISALTEGAVKSTNNTGALLAWLQARGYSAPDLRRQTMQEQFALLPPGPAKDALRIRLDAARTSVAKLRAMTHAASPADDKIRGVVQYYGAGRTGRWAGRLIQPQNFPRGTIKTQTRAVAQMLAGISAVDLEMFHADSAMGIVASCLRACIVPDPGHRLVVADLAQIEARVVAWLAGQTDLLDVFRRGEDVYVYAARKIGSGDRQLGKVVTLACGFGMGPPKFQATAQAYGLRIGDDESREVVASWRKANGAIVQLWQACGDAALQIAKREADMLRVGPLLFERRGRSMLVTLPSGRQLVYRGVGVAVDEKGREGVEYDGVDQRTRKWTRIRTYGGKLVENFTQATARDVMRDALIAYAGLSQGSGPARLTVHDEVIASVPAEKADEALGVLLGCMRATPAWAPGLPVNAEGQVLDRYRK